MAVSAPLTPSSKRLTAGPHSDELLDLLLTRWRLLALPGAMRISTATAAMRRRTRWTRAGGAL